MQHASVFLERGPHAIGSVYKKAVYTQYADDKYAEEVAKPPWLGFLGPVLRAEVGDVIVVHLKNFASRSYSLHPHGVFYEKDSEGALYPDGTSGRFKLDDAVPPGGNHTYRWEVTPEFAPADGDANCLTWVYHSHIDAPRDIASGLIGALLTCRKGSLRLSSGDRTQLERTDVDRDFFLMFSVVDENLSWYLEENIETRVFSPLMDVAINGYVFANLPGLEMCLNRTVSWHLFGMGNEVDIHSAYFHGHTVLQQGHRADVLSLFPATFITADMVPRTVGRWMLSCQVNDHVQGTNRRLGSVETGLAPLRSAAAHVTVFVSTAGMQAFYTVSSCGGEHDHEAPPGGKKRQYYIAAEEVMWNYAPLGIDTFQNISLTSPDSHSETFFGKTHGRLGGVYQKARYVEYTDETFSTKKVRGATERHLGILGPVIRAESGDLIEVTFLNKASRAYSIQPHGLQYDKANEGAHYGGGTLPPPQHCSCEATSLRAPAKLAGDSWSCRDAKQRSSQVTPGNSFTYRWRVAEGPAPSDPACISYLYYSAADPIQDTSSGLVGPLLVCKEGSLDESGSQ
ncbi:hephaestin-like protein 1-like, partial [Scleropages formosus]